MVAANLISSKLKKITFGALFFINFSPKKDSRGYPFQWKASLTIQNHEKYMIAICFPVRLNVIWVCRSVTVTWPFHWALCWWSINGIILFFMISAVLFVRPFFSFAELRIYVFSFVSIANRIHQITFVPNLSIIYQSRIIVLASLSSKRLERG